MRTFKLAPALLLMLFGANVNAWAQSIPKWIQPGIVVEYHDSSQNTQTNLAADEFTTITVTGVSATAVSGTVHEVDAITGHDYGIAPFSCGADPSNSCASIGARFWVDPADPVDSEFGPIARPHTELSTAPYAIAGVTWTAVTMIFDQPGTGPEQIRTTFDAYSGLVLAQSESVPAASQITYRFLVGLTGATLPATPPITRTSDFYGVGRSGILWQNDSGEADIWNVNGTTLIGAASLGNPGPSWHVIATGDFNRDGFADILWQNDNGEGAIWLMNGTSVIGGAIVGNPGPSWHAIATGDFNGDGYADILWQNNSGEVAIWEMNGTTVIAAPSLGNPGRSWHAIATGDFNGDGKSDILWQNDSGEVSIWEMNGTTVIAAVGFGNPGSSWHAIGTGDFNGDGHSDILWQNTSGEVAIWEMDGTNVIGAAVVGPNPGTSWHAK